MARGKTKSKKTLSERREAAFRMYRRGYTPHRVASELKVSVKTARAYKALYEAGLTDEALRNPSMLRDVLKNTIRSLQEMDEIREDAWSHLEEKDQKVECPECEHEFKLRLAPGHDIRVKYHSILLRAAETRAKLLGALGIKQDILIAVTDVRLTQQKVMGWLMEHLEPEQREALASFLSESTPGLAQGENPGAIFDGLPAIETTGVLAEGE